MAFLSAAGLLCSASLYLFFAAPPSCVAFSSLLKAKSAVLSMGKTQSACSISWLVARMVL